MFCSVQSMGLSGIESYPVTVEVDCRRGLPRFDIVGLPDTAVKESRERVHSAIGNLGYTFPAGVLVVNLAPADTKKSGPLYDLPILLGILAAGCGVNQLHHKVGGALCTLRRSGGMETYQQLLGTMDAMEMVIVTSDYWGAVHGADPGEALKDEEGMEVAARLGRDMAWMVKVLAESRVPVPESTPRPMMNFIR